MSCEKLVPIPEENPQIVSLREEVYYHGLLPREDLVFILQNEGDFIVRCSEVDNRKEIILSVNVGDQEKERTIDNDAMSVVQTHTPDEKLAKKIRNFVVQHRHGTYQLDKDRPFTSVQKLVEFHLANVVTVNKVQLGLRTPIRFAKWEFKHCEVIVQKKLGAGEFGEVRAGQLKKKGKTVNVAIKITKGTSELSKAKIKLMMKEARVMRDFRHNNVVRMYGVAVTEQPLMILLELVSGGSLDSYLQKNQVGMFEKLKMCQGASLGVEYLHKLRCIHRDLAARNCLYSKTQVVKISDFGLSRIGASYTLKTVAKVPIKWCAPESILTFTFTAKTDVWSYGVMCHEIMNDGIAPHEGRTNTEVKKELLAGGTLEFKENVPAAFRQFWKERVWAFSESQRATMTEISAFFGDKIDGMAQGKADTSNQDKASDGADDMTQRTLKTQTTIQTVEEEGDGDDDDKKAGMSKMGTVDNSSGGGGGGGEDPLKPANMSWREFKRKKMRVMELQMELGLVPDTTATAVVNTSATTPPTPVTPPNNNNNVNNNVNNANNNNNNNINNSSRKPKNKAKQRKKKSRIQPSAGPSPRAKKSTMKRPPT